LISHFFAGVEVSFDHRESCDSQEKEDDVLDVIDDPGEALSKKEAATGQCPDPYRATYHIIDQK
jgi:hypothetical protein